MRSDPRPDSGISVAAPSGSLPANDTPTPRDTPAEAASTPMATRSGDQSNDVNRSGQPNETIAFSPAGSHAERLPGVPGYELLTTLGRGGMGVVYQARHLKLNRVVALKMILAGDHAGAVELARFRTEAEAVARLQHPHIVQIYEIGEHDGIPYFSLEFCTGGTLAKRIQGTPLPPDVAASIAQTLAEAMQAAHDQNILHRDLKPANILLAAAGSAVPTVSNWQQTTVPKISDFGLAKKLDDAGQTHTGAIMGTPSYMAPEQAAGKTKELGRPVDVYALGAILYELLTGRPPFKAASAMDTMMQVINDEPVPPRQLQSKVPRDLETICLKCLQKRPERRYATAAALAEDLRRFRAGEPIAARPVGPLERFGKLVQRNPKVALLAAMVVMAMTLGTAVSLHFAFDAEAEADKARSAAKKLTEANQATTAVNEKLTKANAEVNLANRNLIQANKETEAAYFKASASAQAEKAANEKLIKANKETEAAYFKARASAVAEKAAHEKTEDLLATSRMMLAKSSFDSNDPAGARHWLDQVPAKYRFAGWGLLKNYVEGSLATLHGHVGHINHLAFVGTGPILASAGTDRTVKLWDTRTSRELRTQTGHLNGVLCVASDASGEIMASAGLDKSVRLWKTRTGQTLHTLNGHANIVHCLAFSPDSTTLASAGADRTIKLWDVSAGREIRTILGHTQPITSLTFAGDGNVLVSASPDKTVKLWDARTGRDLRTVAATQFLVTRNSMALAPDGQTIAVVNARTITLLDARTGTELRTLTGHNDFVVSLAFAPDGQMLASGSQDHTVKLWNPRTGFELRTLTGHSAMVRSLAFAADGQTLASATENEIKLWAARAGEEIRTLSGSPYGVASVAFASDSRTVASASGNVLKIWDALTTRELHTIVRHESNVESVAFAINGWTLASASLDKTIKLWDARSGQELRTLHGHDGGVWSVAFADHGMLASGSIDRTVKLWNTMDGSEIRTFKGHATGVKCVAISADGQTLASASQDRIIKLWNGSTGQETHNLDGHLSSVKAIALSADGRFLASASVDHTAKLWDTRSGKELHTLRGHTNIVETVAFSPDGQLLVTGSRDGTARIWDVRTGQELRIMRGHTKYVVGTAFSPNGQVLATASYDQTIKLWDVRTSQNAGGMLRFRLWTSSPDPQLHRELAEQAEKDHETRARAFRLGCYLAAKSQFDRAVKALPSAFDEPAFPDGLTCQGVLLKESGVPPSRLLIVTKQALDRDPLNWRNHALHGGALFRNGRFAEALAAFDRASKMRGRPDPIIQNLVGLTHIAMGQLKQAKEAFDTVSSKSDMAWEDVLAQRVMQTEINAALRQAEK